MSLLYLLASLILTTMIFGVIFLVSYEIERRILQASKSLVMQPHSTTYFIYKIDYFFCSDLITSHPSLR